MESKKASFAPKPLKDHSYFNKSKIPNTIAHIVSVILGNVENLISGFLLASEVHP